MKNHLKVKLCGLTRPEDIQAVNQIQPDYIGFVFAKSKRNVSKDQAKALKSQLNKSIKAVGVFVNAPLREIASLASQGTIDMIQLHGNETEDYIKTLTSLTDLPIIKAVGVRNQEDILKALSLPCSYLLLDTFNMGEYGGSGKQFDWSYIPPMKKPFFLAGGLSVDVKCIQAASLTGACCLDVSSSVETNGSKDREKMRQFVSLVRNISRL